MKKYFFVFIFLFITGCGNTYITLPIVENNATSSTQTQEDTVDLLTQYEFNFPGTGWVMEFNYKNGFVVNQNDSLQDISFDLGDGNIVNFNWGNSEPFEEGQKFVGHGWWGKKGIHEKLGITVIGFITPDNKYHVTVSGTGATFDAFVDGMKMSK